MKHMLNKYGCRIVGVGLLCLLALSSGSSAARAGLTFTVDILRGSQGNNYRFYTPLSTNSTPPAAPLGMYFISSPFYSAQQSTNGSWRQMEVTTNGVNTLNGVENGYNDFNSLMQQITNGTWSILFTNATTTNLYSFMVSAPNMTSNMLPATVITYPSNGALNVPNQPNFTWYGPTSWAGSGYAFVYDYYINNYGYNFSEYAPLPASQTSWTIPVSIPNGKNCSINLNFTTNYTASVFVATTPTNAAHQAISGWASATTLETGDGVSFAVTNPPATGIALVAHYTFDNSGNLGQDSSGHGYDLNYNGGSGVTSSGTAQAGSGAASFDGGSFFSYTTTPSNILSTLAGDFTLSFWIKTSQNNGNENGQAYAGAGIVAADVPDQHYDIVPAALDGGQIGFNTGPYDDTINSTGDVNNGNYHHVAITRNQTTGEKHIYIDGVLNNSQFATLNPLSDPRLVAIGCQIDASQSDPNIAGTANYFNGLLDDIQIYTGVLSSSAIAQLHSNPGSTAAVSGSGHTLIAHYAFDDSTSIYALGLDSSPNGNNMITYSYWGPVHTNSADAVAGGSAVQFFGTSSMICYDQVLTNLNAVLVGSFTFSTWVKTTVSTGNDTDDAESGATMFWAYNDHNTNDTIPLAITGSKAAFTTRDHLGNFNTLHSGTSVNDGNYHLITVTRDQASGEKKIYVDGNFEAFEVGTTEPLNGNNYYLSIGGTTISSYTGLLDDLQIYTGVLSASEVAYLYNHPGSNVLDTTGQDFNTALNTTGLTWTSGGDTDWFVETTNTHDNVSAARSGVVTNDTQSSYLQTTITGPGTLSFWWHTTADDFDFDLEFDIDGSYVNDIYGNTSWTQETLPIGPGQHTLSWNAFDYAIVPATDAGYLDEVSFVVATPPVITLNPFNQTNYPGYNVALLAAATSNAAITWQWFKVGSVSPVPNATNALFIPTNSGTAGVAGNYYGVASNLGGAATTTVATVTFQNAALPPDWSRAFRSQLYGNGVDAITSFNIACLLDSVGNIYTVGSLNGTNTFGSDTLISANGVDGSSFLKQTATGTPIWGRCMTNNGNGHSYSRGIAAAPGDGFYAMGLFGGTNWLGTNKLIDTAGASTYLARFDANGSNLWVRTIVGTNANYPTHHTLVSDPAGNVTLSALISGYTSFGTTNIFVEGQQGVLAQYDPNGNVRWVQMPSSWPDFLTYSGGRIYGCMGGSAINYIGGVTNLSDRGQAVFSLNATNGHGNWVRGIANPQGQGNPLSFANNTVSLAVSGTNIFLVGSGWGTNFLFGPFSISFPPDTYGQYFARYDTNGNAQLVTGFGSQYTWPWAAVADASGNVYVGGDFDTYSFFGHDLIAAPFYDTVQFVGTIDNRIPGQGFLAKFDRNGNPLWARLAESQSSYLNLRDVALASDGVWGCGFFNQIASFGTNTIYGGLTIVGSPIGIIQYHPGGYLAKITDAVTMPLAVKLVNPQNSGANFQFQFLSQSGFNHSILYRTNLVAGNWRTNSTIAGDGTVKAITIPLSVFSPSKQGFIRVSTQ